MARLELKWVGLCFIKQNTLVRTTALSCQLTMAQEHTHTHTHSHLTALCPGLPRWAGTRKVKPIWILLKPETVSGSGISWAICKSAHRSKQITTLAPHHSVFYRPDALPAAQPTVSKHWRDWHWSTRGTSIPTKYDHKLLPLATVSRNKTKNTLQGTVTTWFS